MPLAPAPLMPGTSPLPVPGRRPPDRRALRLGAIAAIPTLVVLLALGQFVLPELLFITPGLQAKAGIGGLNAATGDNAGATFQGFSFPWSRADSGGGYNTPASLENLQSEASVFHMNSVIIPVIADMPSRSDSQLCWHFTDGCSVNTLPDDEYKQAVRDALKAGLVPILELQVRQHDSYSGGSDSPEFAGAVWSTLTHSVSITATNGHGGSIGQLEADWFDNYTAFAVHYAQMSESFHLPYFIVGDDLGNLTVDTSATSAKGDPGGVPHVPGETCPAGAGRRECEWRHVVHAVQSPGYATIDGHRSQVGGGYSGKLIYAASWNSPQTNVPGDVSTPEFEGIAWWDAVDYVGVDAYFPLTQSGADVDVNTLMNAWRGIGDAKMLAGQHNIVARLTAVSDRFQKQVVFTGAQYASAPGANSQAGISDATPSEDEQLNDMQALLLTFTGQSWWAGAFWNGDAPAAPRESQQYWNVSTAWAGNSLSSSKKAGKWLASYYKPNRLPCPGCGG